MEISIGENISVSRYKESRFRNIRRRDNWTNRAKRIGKTTLLKSIFGELRPESGKIETDGRVILLSGVDPGFIPYLSGRQNVLLLAKAYGIDEEKLTSLLARLKNLLVLVMHSIGNFQLTPLA